MRSKWKVHFHSISLYQIGNNVTINLMHLCIRFVAKYVLNIKRKREERNAYSLRRVLSLVFKVNNIVLKCFGSVHNTLVTFKLSIILSMEILPPNKIFLLVLRSKNSNPPKDEKIIFNSRIHTVKTSFSINRNTLMYNLGQK